MDIKPGNFKRRIEAKIIANKNANVNTIRCKKGSPTSNSELKPL